MIPFLIRQENTKYSRKAGDVKFDLSCFGWFNLYQDLFFEEIMNLVTELLYLAQDICYIQNGDWGPGGVGKCSPIMMVQLLSRLNF